MRQYNFNSTCNDSIVEISFHGLEWSDDKNRNSNLSDINVSFFKTVNSLEKKWDYLFKNKVCPIHPWEDLKLSQITNRQVIIGIENSVFFIDPESGNIICSFDLGNTPVIKLLYLESKNDLYILLQHQGFKSDMERNTSNFYKMEIIKSEYSLSWCANFGNDAGLVTNFSMTDSYISLKTTKGKDIAIEYATGRMIHGK